MTTTAIAMSGFTASQLDTIKRTVASDTNDNEFDLFMEACRGYGLDPFRKQIHAVVYNKDNPSKRKMSIIVSRDGMRVIASRCHDYRPADKPANVIYSEELKGPQNPKGIESVTVTLYKQDKRGDWYPVMGQAYWDEFAPLREVWEYDQEQGKRVPTGRFELDKSGQWSKMPVVMISKCAEVQALRAGWPEQFGNVHSEDEMQGLPTDVSASEAVHEHQKNERLKVVGGHGVMMVFDDSAVLEKVTMGQVFDRCSEFIRSATPEDCYKFQTRNTQALREFWAHDKSAALELKKALEAKVAQFNPTEGDAA